MRNGQSLFEVIFAVGIAALILLAVVSLASTSVRNASFARNDSIATKYAQEAGEWLRQQRDLNWSNLITNSSTTPKCLGNLNWSSGCTIGTTTFSRTIEFACFQYTSPPPLFTSRACGDLSVNTVDILVIVSWTDAQGTHNVRNQTRFTNWNR